jgi:hypothetical protein
MQPGMGLPITGRAPGTFGQGASSGLLLSGRLLFWKTYARRPRSSCDSKNDAMGMIAALEDTMDEVHFLKMASPSFYVKTKTFETRFRIRLAFFNYWYRRYVR